MSCIKNITVALFIILSGSFSLYADDTETDYDSTKAEVLKVRTVDPGLPVVSGQESKGQIGYIISKLFDNNGRIGNWYIKALKDVQNNAILRWNGGKNGGFVAGSIYDDGTNVGIGITNPNYKLDISGDINFTGNIRKNGTVLDLAGKFQDGATSGKIYYNGGNVGIGTTNPDAKLHVSGGEIKMTGGSNTIRLNDTNDRDFLIHNNSDRLYFMHDTDDNNNWDDGDDDRITMMGQTNGVHLGVGTSTPVTKLDVRGKVRIDEEGSAYDLWVQGGAATSGDNRNLAFLGLDEDSGDRLIINHGGEYAGGTNIHGGNLGVGVDSPSSKLHIGATPDISTANDVSAGILIENSAGDDFLAIDSNEIQGHNGTIGTNIALQPFGGAIGIANFPNTADSTKLDVNGNIRISGGRILVFGDQTGNNKQSIYGDDNSAFYFDSSHDTTIQLILRDDDNTITGRLQGYAPVTGTPHVSIKTASNEYGFLAYKDASSQMYYNNTWRLRTLNDGAEINGGKLNFNYGVAGNIITLENKEFIRKMTDRGGVRIGADDVLVIGSGESPDTVSNNINMESEQTYITSDNTIHFYSAQQSGYNTANRIRMNGSRVDDVTCIGNCF